MPFHGCIVVIKRSGADGSTFPLVNEVIFNKVLALLNINEHFRSVCWEEQKNVILGSSSQLSVESMQKYQ